MRTESRGKITSLALLVMHFLMQLRMQLAFWAGKAQYWLISSIFFFSAASPRSFPQGCSQSIHSPICIHTGDCPDAGAGFVHLVLLNFIRLSCAHQSRSLQMVSLSFLSCTNSLRKTRPYYGIKKGVKPDLIWPLEEHPLLLISIWTTVPSILIPIPYPSSPPSIKPILFQFINRDVGLHHVRGITEVKIDDIRWVHQNVILPCLVHSCSSRHLLLYSCFSQCVWVGHSSIIHGIRCSPKKEAVRRMLI